MKKKILGSIVIAAAVLAGCSSATKESSSSGAFPTKAKGPLNLYNWTDYIDPAMLEEFTKETGITVNLSTYDSNETLLAKLQAGGGDGYDVIVPSDYMVVQMIDLKLIEKVEPAKFPNGKNLEKSFADVYWDKGRAYTVPYMYGTTGISVNTKQVKTLPKSWKDFFNPTNEAAGKIGLLNDQVEVLHAALRAVGAKECSENKADYQKVQDMMAAFKPKLQVINSDGVIERMGSGEQFMHMQWNGATHRSKLANADVTYVYPSDGLTLWADNLAIPTKAAHKDAAKIFLNWMMDPKVIAKASNFTGYNNGIVGADAFMDAALKSDPAVVPSAGDKALARAVAPCSKAAVDLYDQVWTKFKT